MKLYTKMFSVLVYTCLIFFISNDVVECQVIRGRVEFADYNSPVSGANMEVYLYGTNGRVLFGNVYTDENGKFEIEVPFEVIPLHRRLGKKNDCSVISIVCSYMNYDDWSLLGIKKKS